MGSRLTKGENLALGPIYLGLLYTRLEKCVQHILHSVVRYTVVTHADTCFLQIFLWERFGGIEPRAIEFMGMEMLKVTVRRVKKKKKSTPYIPSFGVNISTDNPLVAD